MKKKDKLRRFNVNCGEYYIVAESFYFEHWIKEGNIAIFVRDRTDIAAIKDIKSITSVTNWVE